MEINQSLNWFAKLLLLKFLWYFIVITNHIIYTLSILYDLSVVDKTSRKHICMFSYVGLEWTHPDINENYVS